MQVYSFLIGRFSGQRISTLRRLLFRVSPFIPCSSFNQVELRGLSRRPQPRRTQFSLLPARRPLQLGAGSSGRDGAGQRLERPMGAKAEAARGLLGRPLCSAAFLQLPGSRWRPPPSEALGSWCARSVPLVSSWPQRVLRSPLLRPGPFPAAPGTRRRCPSGRPGLGAGAGAGTVVGTAVPESRRCLCPVARVQVRFAGGREGSSECGAPAPLLIARRGGVTPAPASLRSRCAVRPASLAPQCASPPPRPSHSCFIQGTAASAPGKGSLHFELPRDTPG